MPPTKASADIDATAAQWAARLDGAGLSDADRETVEAWLKADPRHLGAFVKAQAVLARLEPARALGQQFRPEAFRTGAPGGSTRRYWIGGGVAAALTMTVGASVFLGDETRLQTRKGEIRLAPLPDGSATTLNTATQMAVRFGPTERRVQLLAGEALFDVAKDSRRPFLVTAGQVGVRAVGTSFVVRRQGDDVFVMVREGIVEVAQRGLGARRLRVAANQWTLVQADGKQPVAVALPPDALQRGLAWREGMIAFDATPLASAAAQFARYSDRRIVVDDPRIAGLTITGLFSVANPDGFARAAAASLDLTVVETEEYIRLVR